MNGSVSGVAGGSWGGRRASAVPAGPPEARALSTPARAPPPPNPPADIGNAELYNAYFQNAYEDWTSNQIVGSLAHALEVERRPALPIAAVAHPRQMRVVLLLTPLE